MTTNTDTLLPAARPSRDEVYHFILAVDSGAHVPAQTFSTYVAEIIASGMIAGFSHWDHLIQLFRDPEGTPPPGLSLQRRPN